MSQAEYDVVIVGGGLVGASLACALRAAGLRLGIVEAVPLTAAAQPRYDERTVALAYGARRIFEGMGLWDEIARRGAEPIRRIHVSERGRFGVTRLDAADAGIEALGYVIASRVLGGVLYETMARSGVALLCPAEVRDVSLEEPSAARVTILVNGMEQELATRLIVAADGADSPVRAALGIAAQRVDYDQTAIVSTVLTTVPHGGTAFERFTDSGPLALLPSAPDRCAVVWSMRGEAARTALGWDDETFRSNLQGQFGERLGRFTRVGARHAYPLALTRVGEHVRARLALIGNAAHTVHPVAGQGFNLGLRDVAALADMIAANADGDVGDRMLLQDYADWRKRDNRITAGFTHSLIRIFSNDYLPFALARSLGLVAVDLCPPLKRRLVRITSGLAGRLPRLACGLPPAPGSNGRH